MSKRTIAIALCFGIGILTAMEGCKGKTEQDPVKYEEAGGVTKQPVTKETTEVKGQFEEEGMTFERVDEVVYTTTKLNVREHCSTDSTVIKMLPERAKIRRIGVSDIWSKVSLEEGEYYVATEHLSKETPKVTGHIVAINAGHQEKDNTEQEPIGPGAKETKEKVTRGTKGVSTGLYEYKLTLQVGKLVEKKLKEDGYEVFMVRESNDLNMGTREREHRWQQRQVPGLLCICMPMVLRWLLPMVLWQYVPPKKVLMYRSYMKKAENLQIPY